MVDRLVNFPVGGPSWQIRISTIFYPFIDIEEVDSLILCDLLLLVFPEVGREQADSLCCLHWESELLVVLERGRGLSLEGGGTKLARKLSWTLG